MLVSSPNLYEFNFEEMKPYNVLSNEAKLTMFKKVLNSLYLDFKSHYPNQFITRNLSKETLFGRLESVIRKDDKSIMITRSMKYRNQPEWKPHMGSLTLAMANRDIISYGSKTNNLPTISELADELVPLDSKPLTTPDIIPKIEIDVPSKYQKLCSLLTKLNQLRFSKTDEESVEKDNKMFMFTNGSLTYVGTYIEYNWNSKNIIECCTEDTPTGLYYGSYIKKKLISSNDKRNVPKNDKFDLSNYEWKELDNSVIKQVFDMSLFSDEIFIDGYKMIVCDRTFYYPIEHKIKQLNNSLPKGTNPYVSNISYRWEKLNKTAKWEFSYYIEFEDVRLDITQQFQTVNL